ncbi:dihydroxyacetone kinase family protein [Salinibacterium sp. ZJ450]|uniref:dihydroxyacetone kinase family protein n=1 Tax=Salinibacterium sp. ZJ450 TaxID=2708338 RepID=UPI0014204A60|nr:dihydroxyacetone kinase family protein [Salinibacterium sp. ZJ450]
MTHLITDATTFADTAIDGFVAANRRYVRRVDGGVVRSTVIPDGRVGVVVGGGSGHYPAFAGLVGPGLAAGAVCGNIFASPATGQVYRVAKSVERGAGILLSFGNYAGDVLQFGLAEERLRGEGLDVRTVVVTDDIASAGPDEIEKRRGVAGDLTVFKIAGAAAETGASLDEVERLARKANARTRSLGVAFSGCTLPGASEPLFTVAPGMMAIGLGIHGEPGLSESAVSTAPELADLLTARLLDEIPADVTERRAVVILNGLGSFKYEELFVLFSAVSERLTAAGVEIVEPECGELVTSLDMAGVSLTLFWVDDELERLWRAPADTPAFRKGEVIPTEPDNRAAESDVATATIAPASADQAAAAAAALELLRAVRQVVLDGEDEFGRIDAIAGDGDHGIGMSRGVTGALSAAERVVAHHGDVVRLLHDAGEGWSEHGGGTSGALWGITLTGAGSSLAAASALDARAIADAVTAGLAGVQRLGKAQIGDKTLVDAFVPFAEELGRAVEGGQPLPAAWRSAAEAANTAAAATATLKPRLGRARPHVERSVGHPDAGAVSFARIVTTIGERLSAATAE